MRLAHVIPPTLFGPRQTHEHIIYHAKSRLNTPVWGLLRSPNYSTLLFSGLKWIHSTLTIISIEHHINYSSSSIQIKFLLTTNNNNRWVISMLRTAYPIKHAGEAVLFLAACYLEKKIARFRYRNFILYTK